MANGKMTEGFAFEAYPAEYRSSGVMTIVNEDGVVHQKDLGKKTGAIRFPAETGSIRWPSVNLRDIFP
jgi:DUF2950 family protein